jgi:hypothetical protein
MRKKLGEHQWPEARAVTFADSFMEAGHERDDSITAFQGDCKRSDVCISFRTNREIGAITIQRGGVKCRMTIYIAE